MSEVGHDDDTKDEKNEVSLSLLPQSVSVTLERN